MSERCRPQLGLSRHQDALDFARDAIRDMRREGQSPRDIMRAFERPRFRIADPDPDTLIAEIATVYVLLRRYAPAQARQDHGQRLINARCRPVRARAGA